MKQVAGTLRLDLAQFRELQAFAQFGSDLDKATQSQLSRGQRLTEILKQPQYQPMPVEQQVVVIWAASNGHVDDIPVDQVRRFESELLRFVENSNPALLQTIAEKKTLNDDIKADLKRTVEDFKANRVAMTPTTKQPVAATAATA
jgi:F-type H+-transporting ATPase subunit alpha